MKVVFALALAFALTSCQTREDGTKTLDPAYTWIVTEAARAAVLQALSDFEAKQAAEREGSK